ncbi:apolipophorin [Plakobranchus ocellatus]|uniref:Apolipophorin n=1 Tax=Plakobranchus ocellatus TaxID=259542 RepID=A0AAV4A7Q6_9GAST|nr:apolipophorin [Plakobranchus ocellatus]
MEAAAIFILLVVVPTSLSSPVGWDHQNDARRLSQQCSQHCTASSKFQYTPDKTYEYGYEVLTVTSMHGASDDLAQISVSARVNIHVMSKCEMVLSLSNVVIKRSSPDTSQLTQVDDWAFKVALERNHLRFSFQDGLVADLCPSSREEVRSLNFKRGVLSAFQNSMGQHVHTENLREVDVTGSCPTEYSIHQRGWKSTQFHKVKDLLGCGNRHRFTTALQATPFHAPDAIQSLPLLKGDHKCTQTLSKDGHVTSAQCMESLVFRPFSKKEAGARTHTSQTLTHANTRHGAGVRTDDVTRRTSLVFEHDTNTGSDEQTLYSTREKLAELCRITMQDIPAVVPSLFTDMVYLMRRLNGQEFMSIAEGVHRGNICDNNKNRAKKFFYDALPMVGTSASVQVMVELLLSGDVSGMEAQFWLKSLHFLSEPTDDMILHAKRLLQSENLRMTSLLPVTTLVSHFCKTNPDCSTNESVRRITGAIQNILSGDCQSSEQELVLMALRAVGNLGFADQLVRDLEKCAKNERLPINIRVTALQAFRGVTCTITRRTPMGIFLDKGEDSELRIAAYLAVMECPYESVLERVKQQLEREEVNQVGSFVWTHLTNLQETSVLHKQAVRNILDDEELKRAFNLDKRKFSRNYELSYFSQNFGLGGSAESNLIWSEKSFVPRSAMLNLTVDILGHSVNLLEIGGRIQGVESLLQSVLDKSEFFKGGKSAPSNRSPSRCVKNQKMNNMKEKFDVQGDGLSASVYLRLFGNEFDFRHFNQEELTGVKENLKADDILKTLAKGRDLKWTQSALFLDSTMYVPTVAGMPLAISVNGTTTMDLRAEAKMDLQKFSLKRMAAMFDVRPSGAVQFSGRMSLGLGSTQVGLKMVTTLHTSTAITGSLDLTNGQVLVMEMDTPKRDMDILNVKSEFFIQHDKEDRSLEMHTGRQVRRQSCSSEQTLEIVGYQTCAEASFVRTPEGESSPYYPFTGPTTISFTVHKKDAPRGFKFTAKYIKNEVSALGLLSFDTPGSVSDRALKVGFAVDTKARSAEFEVNSPWTDLLAKGAYTIDDKLRKLTGTVRYDGREHSLLMTALEQKKKGKTVWTSVIELEKPKDSMIIPGGPTKFSVNSHLEFSDTELSAKATINTGMKPNIIDLRVHYINSETQRTLTGSATLDHHDVYSGTVQLLHTFSRNRAIVKLEPTVLVSAPNWKIFLMSGQVDFKRNKLLKTDMLITMEKTLKKPIKLETKITKQLKRADERYRGSMKLNSQFANIKMTGFATNRKNKKVTSRLKVDYNIPLIRKKFERKNKLTFSSKFHDRSTKSLTKYDLNFNCDNKIHPKASFTSKATFIHKNAFTKADTTIRYGPGRRNLKDKSREIRAEVSVNHKLSKNDAEIIYNAFFIHPVKAMEYQIKGKHEHHLKGKPRFETYVTTIHEKGKSSELRVTGKSLGKRGKLDLKGGLELTLPPIPINSREVPARRYILGSTLKQTARKEYVHTVNLQMNNNKKHSMVTRLKMPPSRNSVYFDVNSKIELDLQKPTSLTLGAKNSPDSSLLSAAYLAGTQEYSAEFTSNFVNKKYQVNSWDIIWPERHVRGSLEGGQKKDKEGILKFTTYWDADRDESKKIDTELYYSYEPEPNMSYDFLFTLSTPFKGHRIYTYKHSSQLTAKELKEEMKIVWCEAENEFSYNIWMRMPVAAKRFEIKTEVVTPLQTFRRFGLDVMHKWDGSKHLSTTVDAGYNDDKIKTVFVASKSRRAIRNIISGSLAITSTVAKISDVLLKLDHEDDGHTFSTGAEYNRNDKKYRAVMNATYTRVDHQVTTNGKVKIELPSEMPLTLSWMHSNILTHHINSTLELQWKPEYNTKLIIGTKGSTVEKDYALDLKLFFPGERRNEFDLRLHQNLMGGCSGSAYWNLNTKPELETTFSYSYTNSAFEMFYNGVGRQAEITSRYEKLPYTAIAKANWKPKRRGPDHTILLDASVNTMEDWSAIAKLVTPWQGAENVDVKSTLKKKSDTKWELDSLISLGVRRHISANIALDTDGSNIEGKIETPFEKMKKLEFDWSHKQEENTYSHEAHIEMQPIFNKITLEHSTSLEGGCNIDSRFYLGVPDTEIESLEINFNNKELRHGHNTNLNINYQSDQVIDLNVKSRYHKNKFPDKSKLNIDLTTPFPALPSLNLKTNLENKKGRWAALFDLKTGSEVLEELYVSVGHAHGTTSSNTDIEVLSSVFEAVSAGAHFDWGPTASANVTFVAPSVGRSSFGFIKRSESWTDFQNKVFAEFDNKELDLEVGLKHQEDESRGWLAYSLPTSHHSSLKANVYRMGSDLTDMNIGGFLKLGKDSKPYNVSAQYALKEGKKYALGTTLETPFTKHLSFLLEFKANDSTSHSSTIYGKYGRKFLIDVKSSQKLGESDFEQSSQTMYKFGDKTMRFGHSTIAQWSEQLQTATIVYYKDDDTITMEFTRMPAQEFGKKGEENVEIVLNTPYERFRDVGLLASFQSYRDGAQHEGKITLEYMDGLEAQLTFDLNTPNKHRANMNAEFSIPLKGYKKNKLTYSHVIRQKHFTSNVEITTGKGHRVSSSIEFKNQELTLTVNGPIEIFHSLSINGKYDSDLRQVSGDAWYKLTTTPKPVTLKYDIKLNHKPITFDFELVNVAGKLTTLHMEHEGTDWREFRNMAEIKSEADQLGDARLENFWSFRSPTEFEGRTELSSSYKGAENAYLKYSTGKRFKEQFTEVEMEWAPKKKIYISNGWTFEGEMEAAKLGITFNINTPWPDLQDANLVFSHTPSAQGLNENIMLSYNKQTMLDGNMVYTKPNNRHKVVLTFQKPQIMLFSAEGEAARNFFDGKLNLDWDKDSPVGRVEFVSSFSDKSSGEDMDTEFKFKVNHPVRIMGVDFLYKAGQNEFHSAGLYTWDEAQGNTFSYDLGWANRTTRYSRMLEGHCKLGIPQRSVKYQGSYSDTGRTVTTTSSFNWHADQDETKKVTMTTTVEKNDNFKRVDLNINIPYINKQLNLGAITKGGYGRNLLDTKAEISYSSDPRKTITVTSVISNSVAPSSRDGYNYTLDIGFKHPVSGIELEFTSHVAELNRMSSAGSDFTFLNVQGRKQSVNFFGTVDRQNKRFEATVSSPVKSLGVQALARAANQGRTLVSVVSFEDGKEALKLGMVIDPKRRHLDVEFNYDQDDPNKLLSLSGGFVNDSALTLEMTSQKDRRAPAQVETLIAVRLNTSQLLHTRIQWRPNVDSEIREYLATKLTEFSYKTNDFLKQTVQTIGAEVKGKYMLVSKELRTELTPVFDLMEQEMNSLNVQLNTLWVKFRRFHQQNHMHIRDIGEQVAQAFEEIYKQMVRMVQNYRIYYYKVNKATQEWLDHLSSYPIAQAYQSVVNDAAFVLKEIEDALEDLLALVVKQATMLVDHYYQEYNKLSRKIDRKLDSYAQSLHELPLYRKMVEQREVFGEKVPEWVQWYDMAYIKSQELLQDQFHDFMARQEFKHMFAITNEVFSQMKHYKMESTLGTAMQRLSEMTKNLLLMELAKMKRTIMDFRKSRVTVYDPEHGELQFELYLPVPLKSLYDEPQLNPELYITQAQRLLYSPVEQVTKLLPDSNSSMWDMYYDHVPSTKPEDWVPPFDASAYLIGSQHIITFDKHEFDFLSKCSHVLTRDMLKDQFSVVVNYSRRPKREGVQSLCFTIGNQNLDISDDYKLSVNNEETEMPYTSKDLKIVREGDFIRVQYLKGLEIFCNPKLDLYKVTVSGWYHGRLAGLMGSYDNEEQNDRMLLETANDFEVNRKTCRSSNLALKPRPEADRDGICLSLFNASNSKFRPCFKQVNPSGFQQLCETYLNKMSVQKAARLASEQYRFVCQGQGVFISALEEYATCEDKSEPFQVKNTGTEYQSADVVFVVEDVKCNQWARNSLPSIATEIDKVLNRKGFTENRFGLEGYGGADVDEVSVRTIDGHHFGNARLFLKALETHRFSENVGSGDLARAIRQAADYPFRAGVAKVLVIAPCSACEVSFLDTTLSTRLATEGFRVHILQDKGYTMDGWRVLGTNKDRFFTDDASDINGVMREGKDIQERGGQSSDFCQNMAHQTGGAIFDIAHLTSRAAAQRKFIKAFSSHVAMTTKLPDCQECHCDANTGRTKCSVCGAINPYLNSFPSLPEAVGTLYDASYTIKNYMSNAL